MAMYHITFFYIDEPSLIKLIGNKTSKIDQINLLRQSRITQSMNSSKEFSKRECQIMLHFKKKKQAN